MKLGLFSIGMTGYLLCIYLNAAGIEVGNVSWQRDFQNGLNESKKTGKPVLLFF